MVMKSSALEVLLVFFWFWGSISFSEAGVVNVCRFILRPFLLWQQFWLFFSFQKCRLRGFCCEQLLTCCLVNTRPALQVMRRAQSNSPRIPSKKYHSFEKKRDVNLENLLLLPGYKPSRPRPPSYPAHISPARDQMHVPVIRITCIPEPVMRRHSPNGSLDRSLDSRGRSPGRRVSRKINGSFLMLLAVPDAYSPPPLTKRALL